MADETVHAVGKRKRAIAKVWLHKRGKNDSHSVNGLSLIDYFTREKLVRSIEEPLNLTEMNDQLVVVAKTFGGGKSGQADALRLGISRALNQMNEEHHSALRKAGMLTRDSRIVERKKYGLAGARKRFQFSKR
ncbi:MAG: 30S ribosomal protein S9 [Candidatus Latescibacteria bacterium]|jgi:small subunit ribosomal protein S9|nr:30S ribosomal protein S9 [Candidatus Latescibacterota bacterium]